MSADGFHVHGPHDHVVEHQASHASSSDGLAGKVAVLTAVLATLGAIFSYMGGATQASAGMDKNNAAIKKTEAAARWAYYQSKSHKQNLAQLGADLVTLPEKHSRFLEEVGRYAQEKEEIKREAEKLEAEVQVWEARSELEIHQHHRWAQATTALQISIALAAIALLTRRTWLLYGVYTISGVGSFLAILALMSI